MASKAEARILDGPGKFDLMLALFDNKIINFTIELDYKKIFADPKRLEISVHLTGVEKENEEKGCWLIKGYIVSDLGLPPKFKGHIYPRDREGYIYFFDTFFDMQGD